MNDSLPAAIIKADFREKHSGVSDAIRQQGGAIDIIHLEYGDYLINQQWLIERKTLTDLAQSIIDGRLFRQLVNIQKTGFNPLLLLEGTSAQLKRSKMTRESIQGALITVSLFMGVPILRSLHPEETAKLLVTIARQQAKFSSPFFAPEFYFHNKRPKGKYENQMQLLQTLPGIGKEKAKALLKKFSTIENIIISTADQLTEVEGIGKNTAKKIRWLVEEQKASYQ